MEAARHDQVRHRRAPAFAGTGGAGGQRPRIRRRTRGPARGAGSGSGGSFAFPRATGSDRPSQRLELLRTALF